MEKLYIDQINRITAKINRTSNSINYTKWPKQNQLKKKQEM
jgi:hypothetical protein